ncbi:hypothetical protein [Reinekea sp.]|jgi:hypothetical protein|uniref:hypothetical protein n=1 Tax=Reinekea sp. TaxID=1970455 RepID=UPI00398962DA
MNHLPHGRIDTWAEGNLVYAIFIGQMNLEGITIGLDSVRKVIEELNGAPFTMLNDTLEVEGGTPEAYEELEQFNQWLNTQPLIAKATIISSKLQLKLINTLIKARKEQNNQTFANQVEAVEWLNSEFKAKIKVTHRD